MNLTSPFQIFCWVILALGLLSLLYTMIVVKEEKKAFQENLKTFPLGPLLFHVPSWWSPKLKHDQEIIFHRKDVSYDWEVQFKWCGPTDPWSEFDRAEDLLLNQLLEKKVLCDPDFSITDVLPSFFKDPLLRLDLRQGVRFEGMCTINSEERAYIDGMLLKLHSTKGILVIWSHSSVLYGMVEGPYLEEAYLQIQTRVPKVPQETLQPALNS